MVLCVAYGEREAVPMQQRCPAAANDCSRCSVVQCAACSQLYLVEGRACC